MASTKTIVTGGFVNFSNGLCRVTALVEKIKKATPADKRPIEVYSTLVTIPDTGVELPFDTVLGKTREINNIFDTSGAFAGSTSGNEIINERNMSLTIANDFAYYAASQDTAVISNNILLRMLSGDKFDWGTDILNIIGTNGSVKRDKLAISEQGFGEICKEDGMLIIPNAIDFDGNTKLQTNTVITAFNRFNITIMLEFMYELSSTKKECYRYVYAIPGQMSLTEGDDINKFNSEVQLLCDVRTTDRFFIDGIADNSKYRINVAGISADITTDKDKISLSTAGVVEFGDDVLGSGVSIVNADYELGEHILIYNKDIGSASYMVVSKTGADEWTAMPLTVEQNGYQSESGTAVEDYQATIHDFDFLKQTFVAL